MPGNSQDVLVSVIIPTFNRKHLVCRAIDSVLEQTFSDFEIIVVDDGSTDGTEDILRGYGSRIRYRYQSNHGESVARNSAQALARGKYVAFLDDDDLWMPAKLERQVALLEGRGHVALVATQGYLMTPEGAVRTDRLAFPRRTSGEVCIDEIITNSSISVTTSLFRREVLAEVGGFNPELRYGEDWDLAIRTAAKYTVFYLAEPLVALRTGAGRQSDYIAFPQSAIRRFDDHMLIVEHARAMLPAERHDMLDIAMARDYVEMSLNDFLNQRPSLARERLHRGLSLDTNTWLDSGELDQLALIYASHLAIKSGPDTALVFLGSVFSSDLPGFGPRLTKKLRKVRARFFEAQAFVSSQTREWASVRSFAFRALLADPWLAKNRGLLSVLGGSIMLQPSIGALRKRKTRTEGDGV